MIAACLREHEQIYHGLAHALEKPLGQRQRAATPLTVALLSVEMLQHSTDEYYNSRALDDQPEQWLRRSFTTTPDGRRVRGWVAACLHWFLGRSEERVAEHLAISKDTVKRILYEDGPEIDDLWTAGLPLDLK